MPATAPRRNRTFEISFGDSPRGSGSKRRFPPAAALGFDMTSDRERYVLSPRGRCDLHADWQLAIGGAPRPHHDNGPTRGAENFGVEPARARCALFAIRERRAVDELRRNAVDGADESVESVHPLQK